jgi:RNA polymerase sigma-70 factor, ECF subfamily
MATLTVAPTAAPTEALDEPGERYDLAAVYQAWFRPVYRWIRALGGPGIDAEDLAQEVFIVVQRQLGRFDGRNLAGWLYRIVQFTVRDQQQRAWFRNVFSRPRDIVLDEIVSPAAGQADQLERKQREMWLYDLVNQLNPIWRDSFLLFEVAGLTGEEIASLQGIPAATVRTHLSRARKEIVALMTRLQGKEER